MVTFHLMVLSLVFFRAPSLERVGEMYASFFGGLGTLFQLGRLPMTPYELQLGILGVAAFLVVDGVSRGMRLREWFEARPRWVRWSAFYAVSLATLTLGSFVSTEFYYFRF